MTETTHVWLLGSDAAWITLAVWAAVVLFYGVFRSRGDARVDPIRSSGPIF